LLLLTAQSAMALQHKHKQTRARERKNGNKIKKKFCSERRRRQSDIARGENSLGFDFCIVAPTTRIDGIIMRNGDDLGSGKTFSLACILGISHHSVDLLRRRATLL
jgi:hypothetical protein